MTAPVEVPLTRGKVALVSPEDAERVLAHKWCYHGNGYAARGVRYRADNKRKTRIILLHRFILDAPPEFDVDHQDGNGLNCQRDNLRLATRSQNNANSKGRKNGSSEYKGVWKTTKKNCWRAGIMVNGQTYALGYFASEQEAAAAYDQAAYAAWGEFAFLNFAHHRDLYALCATSARVPKRIVNLTQP